MSFTIGQHSTASAAPAVGRRAACCIAITALPSFPSSAIISERLPYPKTTREPFHGFLPADEDPLPSKQFFSGVVPFGRACIPSPWRRSEEAVQDPAL